MNSAPPFRFLFFTAVLIQVCHGPANFRNLKQDCRRRRRREHRALGGCQLVSELIKDFLPRCSIGDRNLPAPMKAQTSFKAWVHKLPAEYCMAQTAGLLHLAPSSLSNGSPILGRLRIEG